jgi:hypothetical protein
VFIFGTNIILHVITSLHHLHSITSYIILHQWHKEGDAMLTFGRVYDVNLQSCSSEIVSKK